MMSPFVSIRKTSDPDCFFETELFDHKITIGRHDSNILFLDDPEKKVSRHHAALKRNGNKYYLVDCESANATLLNNQKIDANHPYLLYDNDQIQIGDYVLQYREGLTAGNHPDKFDDTMVMENPFREDVQAFAKILRKLKRSYDQQDERSRERFMKQALAEAAPMFADGGDAVDDLLAEAMGAKTAPASTALAVLPAKNFTESIGKRADEVLRMFIDGFIEISRNAADFRNNFIEIDTEADQISFHKSTTDDLLNYLLDNLISAEEAEKRLDMIEMKLVEFSLHHTAMLDGYRYIMEEGPRTLLQDVNPKKIERWYSRQKIGAGPFKIPGKLLPFHTTLRSYACLKQRISQLLAEDPDVFDINVFRKIFVQKYMARMTSVQQEFVDRPTQLFHDEVSMGEMAASVEEVA